jgi:hypothetical protein
MVYWAAGELCSFAALFVQVNMLFSRIRRMLLNEWVEGGNYNVFLF